MTTQHVRVLAVGQPNLARERRTPFSRAVVRRNDVIFDESTVPGTICVVRDGCIRLDKRLPGCRFICLGLLGAGTVFVQEDTRNGVSTGVTAKALVDSTITVIKKGQLVDLLLREPDLASALVTGMSRRQTELQTLVAHVLIRDVGIRLAAILISLAETLGRPSVNDGLLIPLSLTHQELAGMVGATRATVTRKLQDLERGGALAKATGHRLIVFPNQLQIYVRDRCA